MFSSIASFFANPLAELGVVLIGALSVIGLIWLMVWHYDNLVSESATMKQTVAQYQQTIADKDAELKHQQALFALQTQNAQNLQTSVDNSQQHLNTLETYLNSKDAQSSNRPASDVLKNTLRKLKDFN